MSYNIKTNTGWKRVAGNVPNNTGLSGKKVACYGDSIMYGLTDQAGTRSPNNWVKVLGDITGAIIDNQAMVGTTMSTSTPADHPEYANLSFFNRSKSVDWTQYDALILAYGINDKSYGAPIIGADSTGFGFAYIASLNYVISANPSIRIILCTCTYGTTIDEYGPAPGYSTIRRNNDEIRNIAKTFNLPLIDFERMAGINSANIISLTWDNGCHFTDAGYKMLGEFAADNIGGVELPTAAYVLPVELVPTGKNGSQTVTISSNNGMFSGAIIEMFEDDAAGELSFQWSKSNGIQQFKAVNGLNGHIKGDGAVQFVTSTSNAFTITGVSYSQVGAFSTFDITIAWTAFVADVPGKLKINAMLI